MDSTDGTVFKIGWPDVDASVSLAEAQFLHVLPRRQYRLVMLDEVPVSYRGHFVSGVMRPCRREKCSYCASGVGVQVRYLFSVMDEDDGRVYSLEVSSRVACSLKSDADREGRLRGLRFLFYRESDSRRSKLLHEFVCVFEEVDSLPDPLNHLQLLSLVWRKQGIQFALSFP